jgi:hypothetical protein
MGRLKGDWETGMAVIGVLCFVLIALLVIGAVIAGIIWAVGLVS